MNRLIAIALLVALPPAGLQPGRRPPPPGGSQGAPLFGAFIGGGTYRLEGSLGELSPPVRAEVERRLQNRRNYRPRLAVPPELTGVDQEMAGTHQQLEGAVVALSNRPGIEAEASRYARDAALSYEWEGFPEGPMGEAAFAAQYLRQHPQTALKPFIYVFMLHRYRCAFEAAGWNAVSPPKEVDRERAIAEARAVERTAAARYTEVWQLVQKLSDPVVKAVAGDIDAERFLYIATDGHPRSFTR